MPLPLTPTPLSDWSASGGVVAPLDERGRPRPSGAAALVEKNELSQVAQSGAVAAPPDSVGALAHPLRQQM